MIRVYSNLEKLSLSAAKIFTQVAGQAVRERGRFSVALAGGQTPRRLYEILSAAPFQEKIPWEAVHVFWGDERCVPDNDPRRNARMAHQALLDHVCIPQAQLHPIACFGSPAQAADQYEATLRHFFGHQPPVLDLVLLGLGANAHTASLFPHAPVLDEKKRWVAEVYVPEQDMYRLTLTPPIINQARWVVFLVSGADKAPALQSVLEDALRPYDLPAQLIRPERADPLWLTDEAAAHRLSADRVARDSGSRPIC
jgi:6-phosphogluconolactonase